MAGPAQPVAPDALAITRHAAEADARGALAQMRSVELLEPAFQAWAELRGKRAAFTEACARERARLEEQGTFVFGAVQAAGALAPSGEALTRAGEGLDGFLAEARAKLEAGRQALAAEQSAGEAEYARALEQLQADVVARVKRFADSVKPRLELFLRPAGKGRSILHAGRLGPDEAVLCLWALCGRIPSRYGYLFDDALDDLALPPAPLYADEGIGPLRTRPTPAEWEALLASLPVVWPLKGCIPLVVATPSGTELYRLLERGPIMEVERAEGAAFRNLLTHEESQRVAGHLLRQKMEGRIELEISAG
jgi:hypothetical protein